MTSSIVYSEIDSFAREWLKNLAAKNLIASGAVVGDIRDFDDDLRGVEQLHAFAGIGVWSHALRLAGWPDDAPVWTGSCPCQPFSQAGRRKGFDDARHLWPEWFRLIRASRPPVVLGEQVASPDGLAWFDAVSSDLEGAGYTVVAFDLCAAGVGAPHLRQRLYFVALADVQRCKGIGLRLLAGRSRSPRAEVARRGAPSGENRSAGVAQGDSGISRGGRNAGSVPRKEGEGTRERSAARGLADESKPSSAARDMAYPRREGREQIGKNSGGRGQGGESKGVEQRPLYGGDVELADTSEGGQPARSGERGDPFSARSGWSKPRRASQVNGFWSDAEWVSCRDGKRRPIEPGTFPLAHGASARVGRLRAYGNAIVAPLAAVFVEAVIDYLIALAET